MHAQKTLWSLNSEETHSQGHANAELVLTGSLRVDTTLNFVPSAPPSSHPGASFYCLLTCLPSHPLEARDLPYVGIGVIFPSFPESSQCFSTFWGNLAVGIE